MNKMSSLLATILLATVLQCVAAPYHPPSQAVVKVVALGNATVQGNLLFTEQSDTGTVTLSVDVSGLPPLSKHAIHIHENGSCEDNGKAAGGHWNPLGYMHAHLSENPSSHKGDIGNLQTDELGKATLTMRTKEWCVSCQDTTRSIIGKSIIIHEGIDDFVTQPTGGAGGRVGCGIIQLKVIESEK